VKDDLYLQVLIGLVILSCIIGFLIGSESGQYIGERTNTATIAADLAAQGYVLQRVETVGEGARWMVVEQ
jgi:hypothetical protein